MCIATAGPAVDGCHLLKLRRQIAASSRRSALHVVLETLVSRPQNSVVRPQQLSMPVCCLGTVGHPACRAWYSSAQLAHWWPNPWRHGLRSPYRYFLGSSRANSMHENVPSSWWPKPSSPLCVIHIPRNGGVGGGGGAGKAAGASWPAVAAGGAGRTVTCPAACSAARTCDAYRPSDSSWCINNTAPMQSAASAFLDQFSARRLV
jgi:hypothetical protein